MRVLGLSIAVLLFCTGAVCAMAADKITVQLKWYHQAQFAGCYLAAEKGYYAQEGLEVSFLEGGPGINQSQAILNRDADFSVSSPEDLILRKSQDLPLITVAAIYRKSAVVFLSKKDSGIIKPKDFKGKIVAAKSNKGISDFGFQFAALMKNMKVDTDDIRLVPYDPEYKGFREGTVDITPAYFTGGLIKLKSWDVDVNIIYPGDYRVRFYSDILITHEDLVRERPDQALGFIRATLKGWQQAIADPKHAIPIILKYARIKDAYLQRAMLDAAAPLVHTGENHLGWMTQREWDHMHEILLAQKIIPKPVEDTARLFTNQFIEKIYLK